jgi:uncharacterized protein YqgC (DUF456 family)
MPGVGEQRGVLEARPKAQDRGHALPDPTSAMTATLLWILSVTLIVVGLAGTVLPLLPGTAFILAGIFVGAWVDGFARVGTGTLLLVSALAVLAWVLDYVSGLLGAQKAGASRLALLGAALGTVLGLFMGLVGVLFMPLVGAAVGEYLARHRSAPATAVGQQAMKVGVATWVGILLGMLAKVVLACVMVGVFVVALVF